jgi:hypothetical protein
MQHSTAAAIMMLLRMFAGSRCSATQTVPATLQQQQILVSCIRFRPRASKAVGVNGPAAAAVHQAARSIKVSNGIISLFQQLSGTIPACSKHKPQPQKKALLQ